MQHILPFPGFHHYYLGRYQWGIMYTFTFGLLGMGWLIDGFRMNELVTNTNKKLEAIHTRSPIPKQGKDMRIFDVKSDLVGNHWRKWQKM